MASGEIYIKSNNPSKLCFRNASDTEVEIDGTSVSGVSMSIGEIFLRTLSGTTYIYWRGNTTTVYRAAMNNVSSTTEPEGSLWISSGSTTRLLNAAFEGRRRTAPISTPTPTPTEFRFRISATPDPSNLGRTGYDIFEFDGITCTQIGITQFCNFGFNPVLSGDSNACGFTIVDCLSV